MPVGPEARGQTLAESSTWEVRRSEEPSCGGCEFARARCRDGSGSLGDGLRAKMDARWGWGSGEMTKGEEKEGEEERFQRNAETRARYSTPPTT